MGDDVSASVDADGVGSVESWRIHIIKCCNLFYFTQFLSKEDGHLSYFYYKITHPHQNSALGVNFRFVIALTSLVAEGKLKN